MVLPDSHRLPLIPCYLGVLFRKLLYFYLQDYHLLWLNFPEHSVNNVVFYFPSYPQIALKVSRNTVNTTVTAFNMLNGLDCFPFARHYSGNHYCFIFHQVLRCFNSLGCLLPTYLFSWRYPNITLDGLSHSEIYGSEVAST